MVWYSLLSTSYDPQIIKREWHFHRKRAGFVRFLFFVCLNSVFYYTNALFFKFFFLILHPQTESPRCMGGEVSIYMIGVTTLIWHAKLATWTVLVIKAWISSQKSNSDITLGMNLAVSSLCLMMIWSLIIFGVGVRLLILTREVMRDLACGISEVETHTISYISNYLKLLTALFGFGSATKLNWLCALKTGLLFML